jgi:two-component system, NarL family, sensor histidine kinase FusK
MIGQKGRGGADLLGNVLSKLGVDRGYLVNVAIIALIYLVAAKLGLSLAYSTKQVTTVWPPTGIALVTLLILGFRYWPGIFIGAFLANILTREPAWVAVIIAGGNTLEAAAGAYLLERAGHFRNRFNRTQDVLALIVWAGVMSTLLAASIGTLVLASSGLAAWRDYGTVWVTWWSGDMMGDLLFAPFLLVYLNYRSYQVLKGRYIEAACLIVVALGTSAFVFTRHPGLAISQALLYLLFPIIIWSAIRFRQIGVVTSTMVITGTAIWATVHGWGPFAIPGPVERNLVLLQLFAFVVSTASMFLAVTISERISTEQALIRRTQELDQARSKILRDMADKQRLERELREANRRITDILAGILDETTPRRSTDKIKP